MRTICGLGTNQAKAGGLIATRSDESGERSRDVGLHNV